MKRASVPHLGFLATRRGQLELVCSATPRPRAIACRELCEILRRKAALGMDLRNRPARDEQGCSLQEAVQQIRWWLGLIQHVMLRTALSGPFRIAVAALS
jgi:hypothetical protein